jgi:acyl dehydratase
VKAGERIEPLRVRPEEDVTFRYAEASGDHSSVHLDKEFARSVGLPGIILHGLYSMALVARAANETASGDPRSLRSLAVQMHDIAVPGKEIEVTGTVAEVEGERALIDLEAQQEGRRIIRNARAELDLSFATKKKDKSGHPGVERRPNG